MVTGRFGSVFACVPSWPRPGLIPMRYLFSFLSATALLAGAALPAGAQTKDAKLPSEDDYYKLLRYDLPKGEVLEAGAVEALPGGKIAVGTRRGEIWVIENGLTDDPTRAKFTRFAAGLHEVLGLAYHPDGWLYVVQRCDLSRLKD